MAHFAEIDDNNIVLRVLVVPNEQEHRGQDYLANEIGLGGTWVQCSYNATIRGRYPGPGYTYSGAYFAPPQPYPSWVLDANHDWQPPVPMPDDGGRYSWDEATQMWEARP